MKKIYLAAIAAVLFFSLTLPAHALLNEKQPDKPAVVSLRDGTRNQALAGDEVSLFPARVDYALDTEQINLTLQNLSSSSIGLTGEARLERMAKYRWDSLGVQSGILNFVGFPAVVEPGAYLDFTAGLDAYRPLNAKHIPHQLLLGRYRISVQVSRADGSTFWWACSPFDLTDGKVLVDAKLLEMTSLHAVYSHNISSVTVKLTNHTKSVAYLGGESTLQQFRNGNWITVHPIGFTSVNDTVIELAGNSVTEETITLAGYPSSFGQGMYRILKDAGENDFLSATFQIADKDQSLKLPVPISAEIEWVDKNTTRIAHLDVNDNYGVLDAMTGLSQELNAFQKTDFPRDPSEYPLADITFHYKNGKTQSITLLARAGVTYAKSDANWYRVDDANVLTRIAATVEAVQ